MELQEKVAIVTGGGRGIGRAIAKMFAREEAAVAVVARSRKEIDATVAEIRKEGGEAIAVQADIAEEGEVSLMVHRTLQMYGHVDILVNNAAANLPSMNTVDITADQWRLVLDVNLTGPFLCSKAVLPHMIQRKSGSIINISSIGGRKGSRGRGPYRASKAGLINFTETLAAEVYQHGINVNCICPGGVETEMQRMLTGGNTSPDLMNPDEIAYVALFLASADSSAMTGAIIDAFGPTNPLFR